MRDTSSFYELIYMMREPRKYNRELINALQEFLIALRGHLDETQASKIQCEHQLQALGRFPDVLLPNYVNLTVELIEYISQLDIDFKRGNELREAIENAIVQYHNIQCAPAQELSENDKLISMWNEGSTAEDIAAIINLAPGTVRNRITQLRKELGKEKVKYH